MGLPPLPSVTDPIEAGLQALGDYLVSLVPALAGILQIGDADYEDDRPPPWLALRPHGSLRIDTFLGVEDIVDDSRAKTVTGRPGRLVVSHGEHVGTVELILAVNAPSQRSALKTAILQALLAADDDDSDRHGAIVFQLPAAYLFDGSPTAYQASAGFWLKDESWQEEKVFTRDRRATLQLEASIGLVGPRGVPGTQETIVVAQTQDLDTPAAQVTVSTKQVQDDGQLIPYP